MYTYADVVAGMAERFATVPGIGPIMNYEPDTFQDFPLMYTLLDKVEWINLTYTIVMPLYQMVHRLVFRWQDNERAEVELAGFVDAVAAAVAADPHLGGRMTDGAFAEMLSCDGVFIKTDGPNGKELIYRALEFTSHAGLIGEG